eukprot:3345405-Rhodomonas_salina.1
MFPSAPASASAPSVPGFVLEVWPQQRTSAELSRHTGWCAAKMCIGCGLSLIHISEPTRPRLI